jgi:hypothetical protein
LSSIGFSTTIGFVQTEKNKHKKTMQKQKHQKLAHKTILILKKLSSKGTMLSFL